MRKALVPEAETIAPSNGEAALVRTATRGWRRWVLRWCGMGVLVLCASLLLLQPASVSADLAAAGAARLALRYDRALAFDAAAEQRAPGNPRPYCDTGQVLVLQQQWLAAEEADRECIARAAGRQRALAELALGDALHGAGADAEALRTWQRAAASGALDAYRRLALYEEQIGQLSDARGLWLRLPVRDPQVLTHLGVLALSAGEVGTARLDLSSVGDFDRAGTYQQIVSDLAPFVSQYPSTAAGLTELGGNVLADGFAGAAIQPLQQAVRLEATNGRAWSLLSWAEWHVGQHTVARHDEAVAVAQAPWDAFVCFVQGEYALAGGQTVQAAAAFRTGLTTDPKNVALWLAVATLQATTHNVAGEGQSLQEAARYDRTAQATEALAAYDAGPGVSIDPQTAMLTVSRATARWPNDAALWLDAAQVYAALGQSDAATDALHSAQRLDPQNPKVYVLLGEEAVGEQRYLNAAADFRTAIALQPGGADASRARADLAPLADVAA